MQRREFCRLVGTAALAALPASPQLSESAQTPGDHGFDTLTEDYAEFCATSAEERVFMPRKAAKL